MKRDVVDPQLKVTRLNRDAAFCGTVAELGTSHGVARWLFQSSHDSGTTAKIVSAHDNILATAMYGPSDPAAPQKCLEAVLDHEFNQLVDGLTPTRGGTTAFFVFGNTVRLDPSIDVLDSWMGIRFQARPLARPSQVILHARLLRRRQTPKLVLGILGVNLIYGARYFHHDPETLLVSLRDHIADEPIEVDCLEFSGPDCADVDNRLIALKLIEHGLASAAAVEASVQSVSSAGADFTRKRDLRRGPDSPPPRRDAKTIRGGLIDSVHMAGIPKAA